MKFLLMLSLVWQGLAHASPWDRWNDYDYLRPGETVWTESGSQGEVEATFPGGEISVKIGYGTYRYQRSQLAVRGCVARLCSDGVVFTTSGSQGTVNGVFPDQRLSVKIGYGNYVYRYEDLASGDRRPPGPGPGPRPPHMGIRIGDSIWTRAGSQGTVNGIFPTGEVSVKIGYGNYKFLRSDLAVQGCYSGLCSGDSVVTRAGSRGSVNAVFQNGDFSVKIGYGNYVFSYYDLAKTYP